MLKKTKTSEQNKKKKRKPKPHPVLNDKQVQWQHPNKLHIEIFVLPQQKQTIQEENVA